MSELQNIYDEIISGQKQSFSELADVVTRLTTLVPELDINTSGGINNYSQKELEQIIKQFIIRVQKQQINFSNQSNRKKVNNQRNDYNVKFIWKQRIQPYYEANKNSLKDLPQLLNINGNHEQTYTKIYRCLQALDILSDIIYNQKKHSFEFIQLPNKTGTCGKKLTLALFKDIVKTKIENAGVNEKYVLNSNKSLHPNVKDTVEYKYFVKLMQMLNTQKKYKKVNKYMNRDITKKVKPSLKEVGDKIFNKFKSFDGRKQDSIQESTQLKNLNDLTLYNDINALKDVALGLKQKFGKTQVLDTQENLKPIYQGKQQEQLSKQLLNGLPYIPTKSKQYLDSIKPIKYALNLTRDQDKIQINRDYNQRNY